MGRICIQGLVKALLFLVVAVFMRNKVSAGGVTSVWSGTGDWHEDAANWSQGLPGDGDHAVIASGSVWLTEPTDNLASFTLSGGMLVLTNWTTQLIATEVTLAGGTLTHADNYVTSADETGAWPKLARVWIACSNLTLDAAATIDVSGKGYPGKPNAPGCGPGGGHANYLAGGAYGGGGASGYPNYGPVYYGRVYGSAAVPEDLGSGGGTVGGATRVGGTGGGAVRIDATGHAAINGTIKADGGVGLGGYAAGGSGGSILLACATVSGTSGVVRARGGNRAAIGGGGGGGGRIAIRHTVDQSAISPRPAITFQLQGGSGNYGSTQVVGEMGTLYLPDATLLSPDLSHIYGQIVGVREWSPETLTVSNTSVRLAQEGQRIAVAGDLVVSGTAGRLEIGCAHYENGRYEASGTNGTVLTVAGDLVVRESGRLEIFGAISNAQDAVWGAWVAITGALHLADSGILSSYAHRTNGTAAFIQAGSLQIDTGGVLDAAGKGYSGTYTGNQLKVAGYGPGAGVASSGGAHGGASVDGGSGGIGAAPYGSVTAPVSAGSAGGQYWFYGGFGGGAVRLDIEGHACVNGIIDANGGDTKGTYCGGGAGGGIYITCATFAGTNGIVSAEGGAGGGAANYTTGGGGGRIAVHYDAAQQDALPIPTVSFLSGGGSGAVAFGGLGTLYFTDHRFLAENLLHSGEWSVPGLTEWTVERLTISNRWFRFPAEGFSLTVTNDVSLIGSDPKHHRLEVVGGNLTFGKNLIVNKADLYLEAGATHALSLVCGGDLMVTNGGLLEVFGAPTNTVGTRLTASVAVAGTMSVFSSSWVYPWSDAATGGSPEFTLGDLVVRAGGGFDGNVKGWRGYTTWTGWGPGGGYDRSGAGYGGAGGVYSTYANGKPYGAATDPDLPGSNGGAHYTHMKGGNGGGGLIRLRVAGSAWVDGMLTANGGSMAAHTYSGGGSGGGIYLACRRLYGSGAIQACGGSGGTIGGAGGGGGRIAVWRVSDSSSGITLDAAGGAGRTTEGGTNGEEGTAAFYKIPADGTLILLR